MTTLPGRPGFDVTQVSRFDAERLAACISPWDDDAEVRAIAVAQGIEASDEMIADARALLKASHVTNTHGLPGWGDAS